MTKKIMLVDPPVRRHVIWDYFHKTNSIPLMSLAQYMTEHVGNVEVKVVDAYIDGFSNRRLVHPEHWNGRSLEEILKNAAEDIGNISNNDFIDEFNLLLPDNTVRIGLENREIASRIADFDPDVIGLSCLATIYHPVVIELSKYLKDSFPEKKIVVGGAHASALPEKVLKDSNGRIDYVCIGEGEQVLSDLMSNVHDNGKIEQTKGLAFLKNNEVVYTPSQDLLPENEIPLLNPEFIKDIVYPKTPLSGWDTEGRKYIDVMFSRGCKRNCFFCYSPKAWKRILRKMPIENVEKQLDLLKKHGYEELIVQDDNFITDINYSRKIMKMMKDREFCWQDDGGLELERLDKEIIRDMANSNLTSVFIPVHGRRRFDMNGNISEKLKEKAYGIFSEFKKNGIHIYGGALLGLPNAKDPKRTLKDIDEDIKFFENLKDENLVDDFILSSLSVLPGTDIWYDRKNYGIEIYGGEENWSTYSANVPQVVTLYMDYRQLCSAFLDAHVQINAGRIFSRK